MGEIKPITNTNITLEIVKEPIYDINKKKKKEVIRDKDGNIQYQRNDLNGLMSIINKIDSRRHPLKELKMSMKIKDKLRQAYLEDAKKIELTVSEGEFLKTYLQGYQETEGKEQIMQEFEIRTVIGVLEQFGIE